MTEIIDAPTRPTGRNFVDGAWVPAASGEIYTKVNPMRPGETVGEFSSSSEADAEAAVAAAHAAFADWAALPMARRGGYLEAAANILAGRVEEIARDMSTEMGKPLREARGEAGRAR
jgi:NAD-dependent aldehyde dehydrogenases